MGWAAGFAVATVIAIFAFDAPLARWLDQWEPAALWGQVLAVLEWPAGLALKKRIYLMGPVELNVTRWAYALVLGAVAAATLVVPRWRRWARLWSFVALAHLSSRLAMVELKEATERLRPSEWLAAHGGATFLREGGLSFPSGHVTYFLSLLLPATLVLVPRHRWAPALLSIVAIVAACRVAENAHFASDVLGAVALVCGICAALAALIKPWRAG